MSANDFVDLPLLKRLNKKNIISRIEKVEQRSTSVKPSAHVASLSELSQNLGEMSAGVFKCIDPATGVLRGYMAAVPRPEAPGYHLAFFDDSGVLQFGVNADTGKAIAGGGAVTLDEEGISVGGSANAFRIYDEDQKSWTYIYQYGGWLNIETFSTTDTGLLVNGDFGTGDLTGWTEIDPSSLISVVKDGKRDVCRFLSGADHTIEYITQSVSAPNGAFVVFRAKNDGINTSQLFFGGAPLNIRTSEYATFVLYTNSPTTDVTVSVDVAVGDTVYIDSVDAHQKTHNTPQAGIYENDQYVDLVGLLRFNPGNLDTDAVFEGTTDENLVYLDAGNNRVGVGTSLPATKLDIADNSIRVRSSKTPSSSTDAGVAGQIAWDTNYVYVCVGTNAWKRSGLSTW